MLFGPRRIAQSLMCLTADPRVTSSIPARSHTFLAIDHEIHFTAILLPYSRRGFVSYKQKYVHKVLVNCVVKKCG